MHRILLTAGIVPLGIWLYLLLGHGGFWKVWQLLPAVQPRSVTDGAIAAVIPARDEAEVIGLTIRSLLDQKSVAQIHVIVVDDHSSDRTAQAALQAALDWGHPDSLTVIAATALPAGWTGKLWAVQQGIQEAAKLRPRFLLLTDADIRHSPESIATLVAIAEAGKYDLVSFMVNLHCESLAERLLIPPFVFFFFLLYPPNWIRDRKRRIAGAAGGCMLIRPQALEDAGGIAGIRKEIIDDCALAAAVKRTGGSVWLGLTPETRSMRHYRSFAEIERMIARTAFNQLKHSTLLLIAAGLGMLVTYSLPPALILSRDSVLRTLGIIAWSLMSIAYAPMVQFYGLNPLWSLTLPLNACFYLLATIHSALKFWTGKGGEWKGRIQDAVPGNRQ